MCDEFLSRETFLKVGERHFLHACIWGYHEQVCETLQQDHKIKSEIFRKKK